MHSKTIETVLSRSFCVHARSFGHRQCTVLCSSMNKNGYWFNEPFKSFVVVNASNSVSNHGFHVSSSIRVSFHFIALTFHFVVLTKSKFNQKLKKPENIAFFQPPNHIVFNVCFTIFAWNLLTILFEIHSKIVNQTIGALLQCIRSKSRFVCERITRSQCIWLHFAHI